MTSDPHISHFLHAKVVFCKCHHVTAYNGSVLGNILHLQNLLLCRINCIYFARTIFQHRSVKLEFICSFHVVVRKHALEGLRQHTQHTVFTALCSPAYSHYRDPEYGYENQKCYQDESPQGPFMSLGDALAGHPSRVATAIHNYLHKACH